MSQDPRQLRLSRSIQVLVVMSVAALALSSMAVGAAVDVGDEPGEGPQDWPMFGGDNRRTSAHGDGPDLPYLKWEFGTNGDVDVLSTANGTVYAGFYKRLHALDAETGDEKWRFKTDGRVMQPPAIEDGTVYLGSRDGNLYALEAETGEEKWRFDTDGWVTSTAAIVNGTVYVGTDFSVYALEADTGEQKWRFHNGGTSPAVVDGTVFVGSPREGTAHGYAHALDAETGEELWSHKVGRWPRMPAVLDGTVYIPATWTQLSGTDHTTHVYALDAATGEERWKTRIDARIWGEVAADDGTVYIGANDGRLYALDSQTGDEAWTYQAHWWVDASAAVTQDTIYIRSGQCVYGLSSDDGEPEWVYDTHRWVRSAPVVVNGTLFIGHSGGVQAIGDRAPLDVAEAGQAAPDGTDDVVCCVDDCLGTWLGAPSKMIDDLTSPEDDLPQASPDGARMSLRAPLP